MGVAIVAGLRLHLGKEVRK